MTQQGVSPDMVPQIMGRSIVETKDVLNLDMQKSASLDVDHSVVYPSGTTLEVINRELGLLQGQLDEADRRKRLKELSFAGRYGVDEVGYKLADGVKGFPPVIEGSGRKLDYEGSHGIAFPGDGGHGYRGHSPTEYELAMTSLSISHTDDVSEEIKRLMRQKKKLHRHHFDEVLAKASNMNPASRQASRMMVDRAEWFNFGRLDSLDIRMESLNAVKLVSTGMIKLPYECCVFTHDFAIDKAWCQSFYIVVTPKQERSWVDPLAELSDILPNEFGILEYRLEVYESGEVMFTHRLGCVTGFKLSDDNTYKRTINSNPMGFRGDDLRMEAQSTCDPVAIMLMALNTKNLRQERVIPAAKLNNARVRQKKVPLLPYTVVYMHEYVKAAKETRLMETKGTHASPRPHLRRGHFRYKMRNREDWVWIDQCIVNAHKGEPDQREEYRVRK